MDYMVFDVTVRILVDDVSGGAGKEFRASIYDANLDLVSEAWGATVGKAVAFAIEELTKED